MAIQVPGCLFVGLPAQVSPAMNTAAGAKESFLSFFPPHAGADMFPQLTLAYSASREKQALCTKTCSICTLVLSCAQSCVFPPSVGQQ